VGLRAGLNGMEKRTFLALPGLELCILLLISPSVFSSEFNLICVVNFYSDIYPRFLEIPIIATTLVLILNPYPL
jgi:hypothetical protein